MRGTQATTSQQAVRQEAPAASAGEGRLSLELQNFLGGIADDVSRAQAFRALLALKLDRLAFIQGPVARILNRGEMNEYILAA